MKLLDAVLAAETAAERLRLFRLWERQYGPVFEIAGDDRWSEVLSQSLTQSRYPDLLRVYARLRRSFLDSLHRSTTMGSGYPNDDERDCHLTLYLLAEHLEGNLEPARAILEEMLLSGDSEMMGVASILFERMGAEAWPSFGRMREAFARYGVFEAPFHLGKALAACVRNDATRLADLQSALGEGNDGERQALLFAIAELGEAAAPLADSVLELARSASVDAETVSCAFIALGSLGVCSADVISQVKRGIDHPEWFVRGNAIAAAACLRLDPEEFVPLISAHLEDDEGNDWTPAEKAAEALTRYDREE